MLPGFVLFSSLADAQNVPQTMSDDALYQGIEFKMPKVKEPVIPSHSISIVDFGAVGEVA